MTDMVMLLVALTSFATLVIGWAVLPNAAPDAAEAPAPPGAPMAPVAPVARAA